MTQEEIYREKLLPFFPGKEVDVLDKVLEHAAYLYKSLFRYSGESYMLRALRLTTEKILKLGPDQATIIATILISACYSPNCDLDKIEKLFGEEVRKLVESLGKINSIKSRYSSSDTKIISKMFLTLADDIRVMIIRLADRIENMETLQFKSVEKQKANAREILDVYVPICSRLGLYEYKLILEDLAFKYVFPHEYEQLKAEMDEYISASQKNIEDIKHELESLMFRNGFDVTVSGRIKNLFSIYKKLKKKTATLAEIYDIYAMRIVLKTEDSLEDTQDSLEKLYKMLSVLNSKYESIPDRFKDYVMNPKPNGYKSLHTAIIGLNFTDKKKPTEVQIRTAAMHKFAENGFAAHWLYKESRHMPHDENLMKALSDLRKNVGNIDSSTAVLKMNLYKDRIFVLTPDNLVKELPVEATPLDFAFAVHSDVGNYCQLAKVNGNVVPLDYQLKNGDVVEIMTGSKVNTKLSWLEFTKSKLARNRIKNYFRALDKNSLFDQGKEELNTLLEKLKLERLDENLLLLKTYKGKSLSQKGRQEILEEIGSGTISASLVFRNATGKSPEAMLFPERRKASIKKSVVLPKRDISRTVSHGGAYLMIGGERNMPYRISSCCKPKLTDSVVAYVTRNKGVSLHKVSCTFVVNAASDRLLEAKLVTSEDTEHVTKYHVSLLLQIRERKDCLKDIVNYLNQQNVTILSFVTMKREGEDVFRKVIVDTFDENQLELLIANLTQISGVMKVSRI